ncbi:MAG: hypothetical protein RIS09_277 [Actinomycetota bacterium]|jgi:phosphohistidine phosphatase
MRILFVRHSDAAQFAASDFERPLTDIGKEHARRAADKLRDIDLKDFLSLVSPALRTLETWNIISSYLHLDDACQQVAELYNADLESYFEIIENNRFANLIIIGHNPAISQTISSLLDQRIDLAPSEWVLLEIDENSANVKVLNLYQVKEN